MLKSCHFDEFVLNISEYSSRSTDTIYITEQLEDISDFKAQYDKETFSKEYDKFGLKRVQSFFYLSFVFNVSKENDYDFFKKELTDFQLLEKDLQTIPVLPKLSQVSELFDEKRVAKKLLQATIINAIIFGNIDEYDFKASGSISIFSYLFKEFGYEESLQKLISHTRAKIKMLETHGKEIILIYKTEEFAEALMNTNVDLDKESRLLEDLDHEPRVNLIPILLTLIFMFLIYVALVYIDLSFLEGKSMSTIFWGWIIPNCFFAMLFTAFAKANRLSILSSTLLSPVTSLNPFLGSGLLVAIIEMKQTNIMLKDFNPQGLYEAFRSIKKLHHNSIAHLFFVALMSSVGSMLGAWFAAGFIIHYLLA